ncbi:MAG TPA: DUF2336 domain-containing protein [Pseudolabrys sp.]|uniref:DUF2336 domain-containing protein n=1 Tax=Pseudolabrys sp. TaxID=1960880 RepID=UPI002DDD2639|nr:DUF2336 domain-containing protein [Pseudolabrys sp.]HEV2627926.1 DUF2336 domain-containing protein [Pseudolabrys sp.]
MGTPASLLPELEDVVQHGSAEKRAETLRRITSLFLDGAPAFNDDHVAVFDDVIGYLIEEIEARALAELAHKLAPVPNAPIRVVTKLAESDDIAVAEPVLKQARIADPELIRIAQTKGQAHLLALSARGAVSEALADVIVARGDRDVSRSIATNAAARLSENAFSTLVKRAEQDGVLAERVGQRTDIPPRLFRQLLMQASDVVQKRLLAQAKPETQAEIRKILARVTDEVGARAAPRNYTAALAAVRQMHKDGRLSEAEIVAFAEAGRYEETIAALATLCAVPVEVVDRLMNGERADPVLILARAAGFGWPTVRAVILSRPGPKPSREVLDAALENFERLTPATAQRVVRFWQVRQGTGE